jgi:threonine dehydratase
MGLEILEDCPEVRTVICAIGGGGLITGVGSAIKAKNPDVKVLGAEPETAAPYALSLREGGPRKYTDWQASFVDGAGGKSVLETMWPLLDEYVHESIVVSLDEAARAMRLVAERARVIAEGAGACAVAAAVAPAMAARGHKKVVAVVSGGNVDLTRFAQLVGACPTA